MLKLLTKWNAPRIVKVWWVHIKYCLIFSGWFYVFSFLMPAWLAGLIAFWFGLSRAIVVSYPEDLELLQPRKVWVMLPLGRQSSLIDALPESDQSPLTPTQKSYHQP